MDMQAVGIGITAGVALVGFNAWAMKLVIDNAVLKAVNSISEKYLTKDDFDKHIEQCPRRREQ